MSFPHGYKILLTISQVRRASIQALEEVARTFTDEMARAYPTEAAYGFKALDKPIQTVWEPDGHYTGWVQSPKGHYELRRNGEVVRIKHSNERWEDIHAYGLDGETLEERRP